MYLATLPWYDLREIQSASDLFWTHLARNLRQRGFFRVPLNLKRYGSYRDPWLSGRLLFSQACGYDVLMTYPSHLKLLATPVYRAPGCRGSNYSSFVVVHKDSAVETLEELRGARCVINEMTSHSGMNALRSMIAPLNENGRFFSEVSVSGSHEGSLLSIAAQTADVAAIDCVVYELFRRHRPRALSHVRLLCRTAYMPAPPYVTGSQLSDEEAAMVVDALVETLDEPAMGPVKELLLLERVERVPLSAYQPIARLEQEALEFGYADLACVGA